MADGNTSIADAPPGSSPTVRVGHFDLDTDAVRRVHALYPQASAFDALGRPVGLVKRGASEQDFDDAPEDYKAELIGDALYLQPSAANRHGRLQFKIAGAIDGPFDVDDPERGWWFATEPQLNLGPDRFRPDLAGWRRSRMPQFPEETHFALAPDWVCEILSPSTASYDRGEKREAYARHGIAHLWHVDPGEEQIEAFALESGHYAAVGSFGAVQPARIPPFDARALDLARLWA